MRLFMRVVALLFFVAATPSMAAQSPVYVLIDVDAGTVLGHEGASRLWHPASVTKLMTAYVTFKALKSGSISLDSPVVVSQNALNEPPSKMGYKVGTAMTLDNALKMVIVRSANDIAVAIAETVGGSEEKFIERMNAEARRLGMASTVFYNPNGLPDGRQVTTARDMAVLARALWIEFPQYRPFFKIPAIKAGRKVLRSHNTLLERFRGTNGMKTGFICASGFNVVASATRSGRTLAVVVLGADTAKERAEIAATILHNGFQPSVLANQGPALASFKAAKAPGPAVNMRDQVCNKRNKQKKKLTLRRGRSALEPRFVLMDPVPVKTGVAAGKRTSAPTKGIPIPRPRPRLPGENAALKGESGMLAQARLASDEASQLRVAQ